MEFFHSALYKNKKKKPAKAKERTKKIKEEKEWLLKGCPSAKAGNLVTLPTDMMPEVN